MKSKKCWLTILMVLGLVATVAAQGITVKGTVTDKKTNKALAGVSISEKGTKNIVYSDSNGSYAIKMSTGIKLVFSHKGYTSQEFVVTSVQLNVQLQPILEELQEEKEATSVGQLLQGKVAGLAVVQSSGEPTKSAQMRLRGGSSLSGNNAPLVIVDGVPISDLSTINMDMEEIEYVEVLQDASSAAIYGSRAAANGVVIAKTEANKDLYINYALPIAEENNEEYGQYQENSFLPALEQPLSTFSLDVDVASYSNMRRMVNQGSLPSGDAVRIEELINYFNYDYEQPTGKDPIRVMTETTICPWNITHKLVRIGVKAKEIPSENLPASNFVFLIDVSGSMEGPTRLDLVKASLKLLVNNLREQDRVAIVVYASATGEALASTSGTDKQKILEAINNLSAGGSTAGGAGIQLAYSIAQKNFIQNGNNRVILCTDGDFNVGVSSNQGLEKLIEEKRKTGIFLTVLGYGMGNYKDSKLQTLAQKGNGNHAYIDNIQEANKTLVNEFGSTMYTVAKDVKIQVEFNPSLVASYRLVGYESRLLNKEDFNNDAKDAGELGSGHAVTALYEVVPVGVESPVDSVDKLKYQSETIKVERKESATNIHSNELMTVKLRYKLPNENTSTKMEVPVLASEVYEKPSTDFMFAMSVAMFGQLLKESDYKGTATYTDVVRIAKGAVGEDEHGYRKEFIRLAESVEQLAK